MKRRKIIPEESNYYPLIDNLGTFSNINISAGYFDVSDINPKMVQNKLQETGNSIAELCKSNKINQWSLYKPSGNPPYRLGDFAGYDHVAKPPSYFYDNKPVFSNLMWSKDSLANYYYDAKIILARGAMLPTATSTNDPWNFVRVTLTFTDTRNNTTLTFHSDVQPIQKDYPTDFNIKVVSGNITRSGTVKITANYMAMQSSTIVQHIEDTSITVPFEIKKYTIMVGKSDCTQTYDAGFAYYNDNPNIISHNYYGFKSDNKSLPKFGVTTAMYPDYVGDNFNMFSDRIYVKHNSVYYRLVLQKVYAGGSYGNYTVKDDTPYMYFVVEQDTKSSYPSSYFYLYN